MQNFWAGAFPPHSEEKDFKRPELFGYFAK
jgi:hypothetical protein